MSPLLESNPILDFRNAFTLREAYCDQGLSLGEIARMTGTSKSHIHYYMTKFGIDRRAWTGLTHKQEPSLALELYTNQGKTLKEVSRLLGISKSTAWDYISRQTRPRPRSSPLYERTPFSGDEIEGAYLLGYRAGDINAFQDSPNTVTVRVSTTHKGMLEMFTATFGRYGHCAMIPREVFLTGYDWQTVAYLDNSFRFLIPRPVEPPSGTALLYAFTAAFSDSDGCWSVSAKRGKTTFSFDITSRNHDLLERLADRLRVEGYHPHLYLSRKKGTVKLLRGRNESRLITLKENTWDLVIRRKGDVKRLAQSVLPYSRHPEKIAKMKLMLDDQNDYFEVMGPKFDELRQRIRQETSRTILRAEIEYKARHKEPASGVVG